jgi:CheY-like chemotaxis protein
MRILVIDDDEAVARAISRMLRRVHSHHVDVAESGVEGVALHIKRAYHLAFVDLHLPGEDGRAIAAELVRICTLRIVLTTGDNLCDASPYELLLKPFGREQIEAFLTLP